MIELVMVRHGPTAWNAEGRMQGRSDQPLSQAGCEDDLVEMEVSAAVRESKRIHAMP